MTGGLQIHFEAALDAERRAERAMRLLARPGAVIEPHGGGYGVRLGASRRRCVMLTLDEATFAVLAREATLKPRREGGWTMVARPEVAAVPPPGRPGVIEASVETADGVVRRNLGESPIAWLARRRDSHGRPWLAPAEIAAAERLREEFESLGTLGRMTMRWDATPRVDGGQTVLAPAERDHATRQRIARALTAVGPGLRDILERVCLMGSALEAAEDSLKLPRRAGKTVLKLALQALARHYRMA
ncbi:DUF6456 domain-containing protein [Caulobacter vibrioides]|nr:DUF6456 domain-containing protein [Caulobacter vibrioides]YP_002516485.1 hypothetical protein CCNA_01112 [Caulobacter vibrioides NA1000]ACL94577.1 hypothetical protein CCNA_01112 [Caulobacter vibrioides NA1000]ATC27890.1 hypothetical protein CA607_05645 [Caulobacter vibrioides]QXZ53138.1 hypothetical protein KZH45_05560 [Caulobacter vibrioides]